MARSNFISPMLLLALAPALIARAPANWDSVKQLTAGKEIRVTLMDGRNLRGEFQGATDDAVTIATSKSQETLSRTMVTKVSFWSESHRLRNALIGFGAGAAGGLIAGAIGDAASCRPSCFGGPNILAEGLTPLGPSSVGSWGRCSPLAGGATCIA